MIYWANDSANHLLCMSSLKIIQPCTKSSASTSCIWLRLRLEAKMDGVPCVCSLYLPAQLVKCFKRQTALCLRFLCSVRDTERVYWYREGYWAPLAGWQSFWDGNMSWCWPWLSISGLFLLVGQWDLFLLLTLSPLLVEWYFCIIYLPSFQVYIFFPSVLGSFRRVIA